MADSSELLAESVLLRAVGIGVGSAAADPAPGLAKVDPFPEASANPPVAQFSALTAAAAEFRAQPEVLLQIHAAMMAGLLPVLTGPGAMSALHLYARIAYDGRYAELPVAHDFLHPVDLLGVHAHDPERPRSHGNFLAAVRHAVQSDQPGLVVLESFNRGPTESYLLPWLKNPLRQIPVPAAARVILGNDPVSRGEGLILAATSMSGSTTAPISADIWSYTAVIDVPSPLSPRAAQQSAGLLKTPPLTPGLKAGNGVLDILADEIKTHWSIDLGVLGAATRLAQAGSQLPAVEPRRMIAECILLPPLSTTLHGPHLQSAVDSLAQWVEGPSDENALSLGQLAQRLQRTFA